MFCIFFFNDTATTEIYTLSLHDALPISLGQTLIVTYGCGWVQSEGGPKEEIRPGDVVWCPPGEKHWHGATSRTAMTHIAIVEQLDGKTVDWMEKVSEDQYQAA